MLIKSVVLDDLNMFFLIKISNIVSISNSQIMNINEDYVLN